jgi:hypothetical protein
MSPAFADSALQKAPENKLIPAGGTTAFQYIDLFGHILLALSATTGLKAPLGSPGTDCLYRTRPFLKRRIALPERNENPPAFDAEEK